MLHMWSQWATVKVSVMPAFTLANASVACFICVKGRNGPSLRDNRIIPESLWFIHWFNSPYEEKQHYWTYCSHWNSHVWSIAHPTLTLEKQRNVLRVLCGCNKQRWGSLEKDCSHNLQCGQSTKINVIVWCLVTSLKKYSQWID